jgi:hypothetical protein
LLLDIRFSRIEFTFALLCHSCALAALLLTQLPLLLLCLIGVVVAVSTAGLMLAAYPGRRCGLQQVVLGSQQSLLKYQHRSLAAGAPHICYYSEFLLVLRFKLSLPIAGRLDRSIHLVLYPDSLGDDQQRRLRRFLRFECSVLPE